MRKVKVAGKWLTLVGGLFTAVMSATLYRSFIDLPDGASHGPLAEAIGPWIVLSILGVLSFFLGIVLWILGLLASLAKK